MGTYRFNYKQPDYSEYAKTLFDNTKDGILTISGWYFDDHDASNEFYRCHLNWDKAGRDKLIADFKDLYSKIEKLAENSCRQGDKINILTKDLFDVWNTYLKRFEADSNSKYDCLSEKDIEDYNEEEKCLMEEYIAATKAESKKRLNDNEYSYNLICRVKRVFNLIRIKAPVFVLSKEVKIMLEGMMLYYFCTEAEELTLNDLTLEELETGANEFWRGDKFNADSSESLRFALKAIEKGSINMYELIATLYKCGIGKDGSDYKKSVEYFELALEKQYFKKAEYEKKQIYEELMNLYWNPNQANDFKKAVKYRELYLNSLE